MMKIAFVLAAAAAVLTTFPPATPAKGQELKMAQGVDVQIGRDRYDRYDRERGRDGATVGIGPGGVTSWPTTALPHGDYNDRTGRPHDHAQGAPLRLTIGTPAL
jgi:hypothetical protein